MDLDTVRSALGNLQQDAESEKDWSSLRDALSDAAQPTDADANGQVHALLAAARNAHAGRGEWHAVAALMPHEVDTCSSDEQRVALLMELGRVRQQELLDEPGAMAIYSQVLELSPQDEIAQAAIAESDERRGTWREMAEEYLREANAATDDAYKAAMLMRSAEVEWRFADDELDEQKLVALLAQAAEADPKNHNVQRMLERVYRRAADYQGLCRVLERWAKYGEDGSERVAAAVRWARLCNHRLDDSDAAAAAYEFVLTISPNHTEAMEFLVEYYSGRENWDKLVQLYELELEQMDLSRPDRVGDMLQIAMLHYKKRQSLGDAALWFERIRAIDPTNGAMLDFYREYCSQNEDEGLLLKVLQGAQRVLPEGKDKQAITREIAKLAESQEDAQKAIEQYKALLRQDPDNAEARASLKSLYRKTQGYNQLVDLLRHELESLPETDKAGRLTILREVAAVYREHLPSETSLVSALNQMLQVDETDAEAVRELIGLYEKLGRWRDLLANQQRLADLTTDETEKADLLRAAGNRWLSQFSNVQNATAAFEALLAVLPTDREARDQLAELYRKRRAWPALFALYESEVASLTGAQRLAVMKEMANLAAGRLGQPETAARLYKEILGEEPTNIAVLDALEKHAERSKDWETLAWTLDLRVEAEADEAAKINVLQKLGSVYEDQLRDVSRAASAWGRVLELQPGHARAVRVLRDIHLGAADYGALEALYESQNDFEGLADVLSNAADRAADLRAKIDLSYRAAAVYEQRLGQPERAFRSYERILAADPMDTKAARALVPLYESDEKWARLPALYESLLADTQTPTDQYDLYSKLYAVSAQRLSDRDAGVRFARMAYDVAPEHPGALEQLERACADAGEWLPYVEAIKAQLAAVPAPKSSKKGGKKKKGKAAAEEAPPSIGTERARALELCLARAYEQQLGQPGEAAAALKRVLVAAPDDTELAARLGQLLRSLGDIDEMRWLFGFRAEHAPDHDTRISLLHDWARFESDTERAAELYQRILDEKPDDVDAISALPGLLLQLDRAGAAAEAIEKFKDNVAEAERIVLELRLAEICLDSLGKAEDALAATLRALEALRSSDGDVARAVEVLQRLVEVDATKRQAAEALADVYHSADERRREADALSVLLDIEKEPARRLELLNRAMTVYEHLDSFGKAFEMSLVACREFPDLIDNWDRASTLSAASGRPTELADVYRDVLRGDVAPEVRRQLCERAAVLHEEQLGDPVGATPYLEQLLTDDPGDVEAFAKLKQILTSAQRWHELQSLYDQTIEAVDDPEAKIEVLCEVAMICEEFMDDSKSAMAYYETILEIDAHHSLALEALDRLWTRHERFEQLASLLTIRLELASGGAANDFRLRLARVHLDKLHHPEAAFRFVEEVLVDELGNSDARELAERLLGVTTLRVAASRALERVYESRDEIRDLVRVLEVRRTALAEAEDTDPVEQRDLLRQIAELKNDRLKDDEGALAAFLELVPLDPAFSEGREELLRISGRLGASVRVADALETAAANAETLHLKGEILMQAAAVYDESLDNRERAETLYHQAMVLDPADPDLVLPAAKALERLQRQSAAYAPLVETLRVQLGLEHDADARAELWRQIAELCEQELQKDADAIAAWRSRMEDVPDDELALVALDRLYEKSSAWTELVEVLDIRSRLATEEDVRRTFMRRRALVFAERLEDANNAIDAYRAMLDEFGTDRVTLSALAELYRGTERWEDLADAIGMLLDEPLEQEERLDLLASLGDLRRHHLSNPGGALEAYRQITGMDPSHARAREALRAMLESDDPLNRKEAAEILMPLYEGDGDDARLLGVLETVVDAEQDPLDRLVALQRAVEVASDALSDSAKAFDLTVRAVGEAVGHTDPQQWLQRLERFARETGRRNEQVAVLQKIAPEIFDGEIQFSVLMRIAELGRDELSDNELALEYYRKGLEIQPDSDQALEALQELYAKADDTPNLLEILERRGELSTDDARRKTLMSWRAKLLDQKMQRPDDAIRVYETILETGLDRETIANLEALYVREERWEALIELYQRQLETDGADRALLHVRIAKTAVDKLGDANRAFDELEAALEVDARCEPAVKELEALMAPDVEPQWRARAGEHLEPIYLARSDYDHVMATIEARLDTADSVERRELLQRLAQLHEEQKEDYRAALETVAKLFHEDLTDESTVSELERLAKVSDSRSRLVEIYAHELDEVSHDDESTAQLCRRSGELYRELGEMEKALKFYRRALAFLPEDVSLFRAVDGILEALERHEERVQLHRATLDHRFDAEDRLALLHVIASLQHERLDRKVDAIDTYIEALDINPDDPRALDTLSRLYYDTERFEDLYELVLKRAEVASDARQAITFRMALAKLCRHELRDPSRAVDQLEEIVRLDPTHAEAIAELESLRQDRSQRQRVVEILTPLYEQADDWRHLIKLNEDRFALAPDNVEKVNVLRQTATLWEQRGGDARRALQALVAAIQIEPDDMDVKAEFERLAELTGSWDELARVYDGVVAREDAPSIVRDYWLKLAQVHDGPRDDPRSALEAYKQVYDLDPHELEPVERMEALATLLSDWETLDWVLVAKADLVLDDEERASIWRRIGEGRRDLLNQQDEAIAAYEKAVDLDPVSAFTLDCLIELYEAKRDHQRLVELYQRRVEVADVDDVDLCYELLLAASKLYEEQFSDRSSAIDMLTQAAERKPQDAEILSRLQRLYKVEARWPEALDNLRVMVEAAETVEARVAAQREMGDILVTRLESFDEALDAYASVLETLPADEHSRARVMDLGNQHEDLRERVAEILVPALRGTGASGQHVEVLEMRLTVESDPHTRADTLRAIAAVLHDELQDVEGAKKALLRGMAEVPEDLELHARIEDLCQQTQDWASYADALSERANNTFEADLARDLFARLGNIAESRLVDAGRAIDAYRKAVDQVGDEPDLLLALDRLYDQSKNWTELVDVLERRTALVDTDSERASLYYRLAVIQSDEFGETGQGLASLRTALDLEPTLDEAVAKLEGFTDRPDLFDEASEILESVYRSRGTLDKLAGLYGKRVSFAETPGERIEMRRGLARVLEEELNDAAGAQTVLQDGLIDDPADGSMVDEIERLAGVSGKWESAAEALSNVLIQSTDIAPDIGRELAVRAADWYAKRVGANDKAEEALKRAFKFDPTSDEVLIELEALQRGAGNEAGRVETLRARARLQLDEGSQEELFRAAVETASAHADPTVVEETLREALTILPDNVWAIRQLAELRERASDFAETFGLIHRLLDLVMDADELRRLRHRGAELARVQLKDAQGAIALLERALEDDPLDAAAATGLRALFEAEGQYEDLARLLERIIEVRDEAAARAELRLELAQLQRERFEDAESAMETLRIAMEDDPTNSAAVVELSKLYEELGKDELLAELLNEQIAAARERGDERAELDFEVRLAEIYESKIGDPARAMESFTRVLDKDPNHEAALDALVRLNMDAGQTHEAIGYLDRLCELTSGERKAAALKLLANAYLQIEDNERAATTLETAMSHSPDDVELRQQAKSLYEDAGLWDKLGRLLAGDADRAESDKDKVGLLRQAAAVFSGQLSDWSTAAELLEKANEAVPGDRELLLELCDAYNASSRAQQAIETLEKVVESYGTRRSKELAEIHRRLATAYQKQGQLEKAAEELDRAFRIEPGNIAVLHALGQLSLEIDDLKRAQQMFRALLLQKLDKNSPITKAEIFYYLAVVHQRLGEKTKAEQMVERALQADSGLQKAVDLAAELKG